MLPIKITFPAGRYHATPWGRHVNEADVEWPPSPWRLLRAMIAVWHRKLDHQEYPGPVLEKLIQALTGQSPIYRLPKAVHAHTRHYMPVREGKTDKKNLIFDAFLRLDPSAELIAAWPDAELDTAMKNLLDALLENLGFLGRAESWTQAERLADWEPDLANCVPGDLQIDMETGTPLEPVRLMLPLTAGEYSRWRQETLNSLNLPQIKPKKKRELLEKTIPATLLEAMQIETGDLRSAGWSRPPGSTEVLFQRPTDALTPGSSRPPVRKKSVPLDTCRFALSGNPLPLVEDSVRVGEWMRQAVMGTAKKVLGEDQIPFELSGHSIPKNNCHGHAFFLPEDKSGDGRIDHILIHAPAGFSNSALRVFDNLFRIWNKKGEEWNVLLEGVAQKRNFARSCPLCTTSSAWVSITPYLHPWYVKKKFTLEDQVRRECRQRELPEPSSVEILPEITLGRNKKRRCVHFHRFRSKQGLTQPDTQGRFLRLTYSEPVQGPLALGFGCHFGLGLFEPGKTT